MGVVRLGTLPVIGVAVLPVRVEGKSDRITVRLEFAGRAKIIAWSGRPTVEKPIAQSDGDVDEAGIGLRGMGAAPLRKAPSTEEPITQLIPISGKFERSQR